MNNYTIAEWLNYEQRTIVTSNFWGLFKKRTLCFFKDDVPVSIDFHSNWNALMNLVDAIELKGYSFIISRHEVRVERDFENHQHLAPIIKITFRINRADVVKKQIVYKTCIEFISEYNRINNTSVNV